MAVCRSCKNPVRLEQNVFCPYCGDVWKVSPPPKADRKEKVPTAKTATTTSKAKPKTKPKTRTKATRKAKS